MLGQVFTAPEIVERMLALRRNTGRVLEPSCGDGAFSSRLPGCVAIEYDERVCPSHAINMDFFAFPVEEKFETIIGNPPYVKYQNICPWTLSRLDRTRFDERSNLYLFFIEKCIRHLVPGGELIFITPRDFLKATSAARLNEFIHESGTITDLIDLGDQTVFRGFSPNCIIFRFEKGNFSRKTSGTKTFQLMNGQLVFSEQTLSVPLSELFYVKVGAVSGADEIFTHPNGNREFVCSKSVDTGQTRRMFYDVPAAELVPHKERLLARRIRAFDEHNWWKWGRGYHETEAPRIYVNAKTRRPKPFFLHECKAYDGSVLALFPKDPAIDLEAAVAALNEVDWHALGFMCDGRHLFSQKSLEGACLPAQSLSRIRRTSAQAAGATPCLEEALCA